MLRIPTALCTAAAVALLVGATSAQAPMTTTRIATGFSTPTFITSAPDDSSRLFVLEQFTGRIEIILNGVVLATPFIDLNPIVINSGNERGLLGMAFHPDYANNRKFYVSYNDNSGASVIREYLRDAVDPNLADPGSFTTIFGPIAQPFSNHNGGCIQFGGDGMLYFGLGDGGSANDPGNRAQTLTNVLGKMHRLDVDNGPTYVPVDNPYIGAPNDPSNTIPDTIWAYGLRNPWRFSFDMWTGDLWIADVGQNAVEEIDFQPASSTGTENYGWRCMEGNNCTGLSGCTCNAASLTDPIHTYGHGGGACSVTGGYVYRGDDVPGLGGTYFFADYCSNRIWSLRYDGSMVTGFTDRTAELVPNIGTINQVTSFGQDADGEMYLVDQGGEIFKIGRECTAPGDCTQAFCIADDNALDFCPCGNAGSKDTGCDIAQLTGGVKTVALGQNTVTPQATIQGSGFPAMQSPTAIVIRSTGLDANGPQVFGDGVRCIATSPLVRLAATTASGGTSTHVFGHGAGSGLFFYQVWFRNTLASYCDPTAAYNLSSGITLLW